MKNQYFGDLNDYSKYGLLRAFGREMSVAVIWMMTPDDGSGDGRKLGYLDFDGRRPHDPELFDWLKRWKDSGAPRDVRLIETSGLLPNCRFFHEPVPEDLEGRRAWFRAALEFARGSDLVFLDPDHGIEIQSVREGKAKSSRFVYLHELQALYEERHSVLICQHTARTTRRNLIRSKLAQLYETFGIEFFETFSSFDWIGFLLEAFAHGVPIMQARAAIARDWEGMIHLSNNFVVPVPMTQKEIKRGPARVFREQMARMTTTPGYVNRHDQRVVRPTELPGTDHGQRVYVVHCQKCEHEYGAKGSDLKQRKCPECQGGAAGLASES